MSNTNRDRELWNLRISVSIERVKKLKQDLAKEEEWLQVCKDHREKLK